MTDSSSDSLAGRIVDRRRGPSVDIIQDFHPSSPSKGFRIRNTLTMLYKYQGHPASLTVHLYRTHFRFGNQEGVFLYDSPMKALLKMLREEEIPSDSVEIFAKAGVRFYEGRLIVEVHDHRSEVVDNKSITQLNEHLIPFRSSSTASSSAAVRPSSSNMAIDGMEFTYRTVLHPTSASFWADMMFISEKSKGKFYDALALAFEAQVLAKDNTSIVLTPARNIREANKILELLATPYARPAIVKKRKPSEYVEYGDDSVQKRTKMLLMMDEQYGSEFQPKFQRFAYVEAWKKMRERAIFLAKQQMSENPQRMAQVKVGKRFDDVKRG